MQPVEGLIHAAWIIPVEPHAVVHKNYSLAFNQGRIIALMPTADARQKFSATHEYELGDHVLIPGLVNTHTHLAMSLLRGYADDLPVMDWLQQHIWPAEHRWASAEFVADGTLLGCAEMLRGGVTCFNDMYFFPDITAQVAQTVGLRAVIGLIVFDFPTVWAANADEYLSKGLDLYDRLKDQPLLRCAFAPHAPYTVSDQPLERIRTLADELSIPIHMHVHESEAEVTESIVRFGLRPLQRLDALGLLSPSLLAVHMTQLIESEIELIAKRGVQVIHCPESNLKLASGFCPVTRLMAEGVNVALGTDGAASNNDLDMLGELRTAALLAKGITKDARALPAADALRMATLNGARALGLDQEIGSLELGKAADLVALDLNALNTLPLYSPLSQLVYSARSTQVSHVWVNGRLLLNDRQFCPTAVES